MRGAQAANPRQFLLHSRAHPKARIMSIRGRPQGPADAHDARLCYAHHEPTVAGGSSFIGLGSAAPRRPERCCASQPSPADFECRVRACGAAAARITSISGTADQRRTAREKVFIATPRSEQRSGKVFIATLSLSQGLVGESSARAVKRPGPLPVAPTD